MNTKHHIHLLALLLCLLCHPVAWAVDNDRDGLDDAWESANGRNPAVSDYGVALGSTWLCVKSDSGVACNGTGYPATPGFSVKTSVWSGGTVPAHTTSTGHIISESTNVDIRNTISANGTASSIVNPNGNINVYFSCPVPPLPPPFAPHTGCNSAPLFGLNSGAATIALQVEAIGNRVCYLRQDFVVQCTEWDMSSFYPILPYTPTHVVEFQLHNSSLAIPTGVLFDADRDSIANSNDNCWLVSNVNQLNSDSDAQGDACDTMPFDGDNDGTDDPLDNCPTISNADQLNTDGDAQGNVCDSDDDNDGVADTTDKFPLDPAESVDTDNDGTGNNADTDDDNDGVFDTGDNCPLYANSNQSDADSDGVGDPCDTDAGGVPDSSFHPTGFNSSLPNVYSIQIQPDGKIIIGGYFSTYNQTSKHGIARFNTDGSLDLSFSASTNNSYVFSSALQSDNKIVLAGNFTTINGVARNYIARVGTTGELDNSFDPGTGASGTINTVILQPDGKIVAGGGFTAFNGVAINKIIRLNTDGTIDSTFNPGVGPNSAVQTIAMQDDGKILIGGDFTQVNGISLNRIARLNADGSVDTSFNLGTGANREVNKIVAISNGKIMVGGQFSTYNGISAGGILRLNSDGSLDNSFNPGTGVFYQTGYAYYVYTITVQRDEKIIIGGYFWYVNGVAHNSLVRLNSDGSLDTTFIGAGGTSYNSNPSVVRSSAIQADGKILIGGWYSKMNGSVNQAGLTRLYSGNADGDIVEDAADNCASVANDDQLNTDGATDGGDACDADDDNDGMPDAWETTYGFNPLVNDASGDADNDGLSNLQEYTNGSNPTIRVSKKNDYNNDSIAGWIWQGVSNGNETQSQNWQLTFPLYSANWAVPNRFYHPTFADQANWAIVTSGDFNKDGDADTLWRHKTTDAWKIWQMQGGLRVAQTNWTDSFDPTHQWTVVGAGDTDKDGDDDVILNNTATGEVIIWQMQNHAVTATHNIGTKAGFTLNRIGDFNKDGDVDLLFRQNGADALITWEIENNAFTTERALANTGVDYSPVCAGDFDKDGDDDIMLVNSVTTQEKWFVVENYTRTQQFGGDNTGFTFLGCGDYDGDGDADILWKRDSDDLTRVVLQQNWGATKQTVYTNAFGGANGFVYRANAN